MSNLDMLKKFVTSILFILFLSNGNITLSQEIIEPSDVKWYSIEEADSLLKIQAKPLLEIMSDHR